MRYDLRVFWVEDTDSWLESAKKLLVSDLEAEAIFVNFEIGLPIDSVIKRVASDDSIFHISDLLFMDYNISKNGKTGADLIRELRKKHVDVDILFYSAGQTDNISGLVEKDFPSFEGVYLANRDTFNEKAIYLIKKGIRRQRTIQNIRGMLMDNTSENDFIMKSYIIEKYSELGDSQKKEIDNMISLFLDMQLKERNEKITLLTEEFKKKGIQKIKKFFENGNDFIPLNLRYAIFEYVIKNTSKYSFTYDDYKNKVIDYRNKLAHKKLEVCDNLSHIKYCDTLEQYNSRDCKGDCCEKCNSDFKISMEEWEEIRKDTIGFSNMFDSILDEISK